MKFCKDCVYYRFVEFKPTSSDATYVRYESYHTCTHPDTADIVTGQMPLGLYCTDVRSNEMLCGREARWFKKPVSIAGGQIPPASGGNLDRLVGGSGS